VVMRVIAIANDGVQQIRRPDKIGFDKTIVFTRICLLP
jgi:hypothetical protein